MSSQDITSSKKINNTPGLYVLLNGKVGVKKQFDPNVRKGKDAVCSFCVNSEHPLFMEIQTLTSYIFDVDSQDFIRRQTGQLFFQFHRQFLSTFWCSEKNGVESGALRKFGALN
jgi:hypothetical protein